MSYADEVFIRNCREILQTGVSDKGMKVRTVWKEDGKPSVPAYSMKKFGIINRYDLSKEFPILTLRKIAWQTALKELLWIWQKKSNKLEDLGNIRIWDQWVGEDGTIGKAYGYQLGVKHKFNQDSVDSLDQVDKILYDLKNDPASRRILANIYIPHELHEMNLYPCVYCMQFDVTEGKLNAILNQRSQDMLPANNWNVCQYALLVHMFAQVSGLQVGELIHVIGNAHIYDRHVESVEMLLTQSMHEAPQLEINKSVTDFYEFLPEHFKLKNYTYSCELSARDIPIAV